LPTPLTAVLKRLGENEMTDKAIKALTREIKKLRKSLDHHEIGIINCKAGLIFLETQLAEVLKKKSRKR
jgi:hypothetical protein